MTQPNTTKAGRSVVQWDLRSLKLHPMHSEFSDPTDAEIDFLARDIKERNLQHRIEITPDGVIIAGRKRWLALKSLGFQKFNCVVRHDLAADGEFAISRHLTMDNLARRQHSDLEIARVYRAFKCKFDRSTKIPGRDLRDVLGEQFGMSGGALDRLSRILDAPRAVQDAYERGEIRQVDAAKVGRMPTDVQEKICAAMMAKTPAQEAFDNYAGQSRKPSVASSKNQAKPSMEAAVRSLTFATAEIKELAGAVTRLRPNHVAIVQRCTTEWLALLEKSRT